MGAGFDQVVRVHEVRLAKGSLVPGSQETLAGCEVDVDARAAPMRLDSVASSYGWVEEGDADAANRLPVPPTGDGVKPRHARRGRRIVARPGNVSPRFANGPPGKRSSPPMACGSPRSLEGSLRAGAEAVNVEMESAEARRSIFGRVPDLLRQVHTRNSNGQGGTMSAETGARRLLTMMSRGSVSSMQWGESVRGSMSTDGARGPRASRDESIRMTIRSKFEKIRLHQRKRRREKTPDSAPDDDWRAPRLAGVWKGHERDIYCLKVLDDGPRLASGSLDHTVKIWDCQTGEVLHTLIGHDDTVTCLCARGDDIFSGSLDKTIRRWNHVTGELVQTMLCNSGWVKAIDISGNYLISGGWDETVKVWDPKLGVLLHSFHLNRGPIVCLQASDRVIVAATRGDGYQQALNVLDFGAGSVNLAGVVEAGTSEAWAAEAAEIKAAAVARVRYAEEEVGRDEVIVKVVEQVSAMGVVVASSESEGSDALPAVRVDDEVMQASHAVFIDEPPTEYQACTEGFTSDEDGNSFDNDDEWEDA
ncbi:hypothetical protein HK101_009784 [Irineochytrium annulatum]|nr:hypothetical protein HK101_009784 [Irineochytrium annulatum]